MLAAVVDGTEQVGAGVTDGVTVAVGVKVRVEVMVAIAVPVEGVLVIVGVLTSVGVSVGSDVTPPASLSDTNADESVTISPSKNPTRSRGGLGFEAGCG